MKNKIPIQFRDQFKTFEEYKDWCLEKSKKELMRVFEKTNVTNLKINKND
jgi:hypothetical protein